MVQPTEVSITLPTETWLKLMSVLTDTPNDAGLTYIGLIEEGLLMAGIGQESIDKFDGTWKP